MTPPPAGATALALYRRLLTYAWPYKGVFLVAVVGMLGMAAAETGFAALLKPIMDDGFVARDASLIRWLPVVIVALFAARGLAEFVATYCMSWVGRRVIFDLRNDMFARMLQLPTAFYDTHASATLVSKLIYDVEQTAAASTDALKTVIKDTLTTVALLGWMLYLSWRLTVVFVVVAPLAGLMVRTASRRFRTTSRRIQATVGGIAQVAKEAFQGHRVVKTFGGQRFEHDNFRRENNRNRQQAMKRATVQALSVPFLVLVAGVGVALVIYVATSAAGAEGISAGSFVSYLGAVLMLLGPIRRLARVNLVLQTGIAAADSVFDIMDQPPETDGGTQAVGRLHGHIVYDSVCFRYAPERDDVLHDVSFEVPAGETVALVGASGSGKSTLAALLLRLYRPRLGEIRVDGVPIESLRLADYRANLSVVTQETVLFDDSIRNNIVYGAADEVDEARLLAVAGAAHVLEFADKMPEGLDTVVGEQGVRLSGGQRQRIAIARALFKDAPILVLDEATSSLDSQSEQLVQQAMGRLMAGRTTLVIAHRLSTIERAGRIVVLADGRVAETGTHAELLAAGGVYATLYRTQFRKAATA